MNSWHRILFGTCVLLFTATIVQPLGIALRFVDITLEKVEPGASFNLRVIRNLPLVVQNLDEVYATDIQVESVLPEAREMKDGYEPIPDPSWIKIIPDTFHLGPKASASSDVIITIPNDPKLVGRHFESILWAHTDPRRQIQKGSTGMVIQAGLRSRLRMSIGIMGPASLQKEKALKKLATINTNFSISPDNVFVQAVPVGKTVDLKVEKKASLKVINESDDPIKLKSSPIIPDTNVRPQSGYTYAPDPAWLKLTPSSTNTPGNAIKEIRLSVTIPDKPEYRNQKYMFLVRTTLDDETLPLIYYNMIYVATEP